MTQALSLKAQLEALRGNLRRAAKLVVTHPEDAQQLEEAEKRQMLCNMGCVQHHEGKHHAAVLCFSKAEATGASKPPPLLSAVSHRKGVQRFPSLFPPPELSLFQAATGKPGAFVIRAIKPEGGKLPVWRTDRSTRKQDSVEMIQPAPQYALDAETALLYNAGVQALLVKEVDSAMRCFQASTLLPSPRCLNQQIFEQHPPQENRRPCFFRETAFARH